jgi:hypothetical protein
MGQLADDIVDGRSCSECGIYFEKAHGYPVLCTDCWCSIPEFEGEECLPKATEKEL